MDNKTLNSTNRTIYIILFCCFAFVGLLVFFLVDFSKNPSDMCSFHKELFQTQLDSAVVVRHFVDKSNHAIKTVELSTDEKKYTIYFIPSDNDAHFDKLQIGHVITKEKGTFEMKVNNTWAFRLSYDCTF
jgi:hypothetical protein